MVWVPVPKNGAISEEFWNRPHDLERQIHVPFSGVASARLVVQEADALDPSLSEVGIRLDDLGQPQSLLRGGRLRKHVHPMTATPKVFRADIRWRWRDSVTTVFPAQNDLVGQHRHIIVERRDLDALHGVIG